VRLPDLLAGLDVVELVPSGPGTAAVEVTAITNDSRRVVPGACYACIPGAHVDGHRFAAAAVRSGATALLVERVLDRSEVGAVAQARVPFVRAALGRAAANLFDHPSAAVACLGVTGTNGKTTTTFLLEAIAAAAGTTVGVIGTVGARVAGAPFASAQVTPTTPEACDLQQLLAEMRDAGVGVVAMEVSSHGLDRREVDGTEFAVVCFTNLGHDHLDYHGSLDAYFEAKARLFDGSFAPQAVVNVDDDAGQVLAARASTTGARVRTFGLAADASVTARDVVAGPVGSTFTLHDRDADASVAVALPLVGSFNVSNALAAAATALAAGFGIDAVAAGLARTVPVPGRMEPIDRGQGFAVVVDYAHTPDALVGVLDAARPLAPEGRVIVVFGAGGDRDRAKRPLMGEAVSRHADVAVLTSDNPRTEDPAAIAAEVAGGFDGGGAQLRIELDRRAAIRLALGDARPGDVVIVAGKGHETGQTVGTTTAPFDDRVVVAEELESLGWR
jgi:UDP-N-acetylmuramoyl-L-alanyl-D-glutamate--2,6-diaminopimelate ligase